MSGLTLGERLEQQVAAARLVGVVDRLARRVGQFGKSLIGRRDRRQRDGRDARPGKARDRRAAGHDGHRKPVFGERAGDPAGAGEVADAEQMLDVKEDARATHGGGLPFLLEQRRSAAGCCCGSRTAVRTFCSAAAPSRLRSAGSRIARSSAAASAAGSSGGTSSPFSPSLEQFGHAGNVGRNADEALARRFDQHVGQAVAVAIRGDAAGQRKDVGLPVAGEHLVLRQPALPRRCGRRCPSSACQRAQLVRAVRRRRYARTAN